MSFSIIIPIYNEEKNIEKLFKEIVQTLSEFNTVYEIVLINDASTDSSSTVINNLKNNNSFVKLINNNYNQGQSYSLIKGIKSSLHDTIITLDGDGQNDPKDIPNLLEKYTNDSQTKLVGGIRVDRKDNILKRISSKIANKIRKYLLNDDCDDTGCSLKIFSKDIFLRFPEFDGLHRYLPALFKGHGCKTNFLPVTHRYRAHGKSNYGTFGRMFKGIFDILRVKKILKEINND
tara:strand:- start:841 stop:1539 length:699 start_codon:yes stop_codon:yes gene_type:complete